jgi:hypothetical protein
MRDGVSFRCSCTNVGYGCGQSCGFDAGYNYAIDVYHLAVAVGCFTLARKMLDFEWFNLHIAGEAQARIALFPRPTRKRGFSCLWRCV